MTSHRTGGPAATENTPPPYRGDKAEMRTEMLVRVAPEALVVDAPPTREARPPLPPPTPPVEVVTAADVLERAADLLGEFGWCQGTYGSKKKGAFCAIGATNEARRELAVYGLYKRDNELSDPHEWAHDHAGLTAYWNDEPGRTKAEVVAKLREAARHARGQELGGHGLGAVPRSAGGS